MDDPLQQGHDVLTQSEVERLLAQVAEQETKAVVHRSDGEIEQHSKDAIQPYDFRHPAFLSAGELRKLRVEHEEFLHSLAARLSMYLRLEFSLQMSKLQTLTYAKFVESITNPAHLAMFKVEPMRGICVLDINPRLGLTIIDRLMGGPGHSVTLNRDLSEIEVALLDQAVQVILGEWCHHWSSLQDLRPVLLGHENNGRFLQTSHPDTIMLILAMEARLGDCMEQIQIGFPYAAIEPLVRQLGQKLKPDGDGSPQRPSTRWHADLEKVQIKITAESVDIPFKARDLVKLKVGDVIPLEQDLFDRLRIRLATMAKFSGRLGIQEKKWAVEINQILKT